MGLGVTEVAEQLLELRLVTGRICQASSLSCYSGWRIRIGVAIEAKKVDFDTGISVQSILQLARGTVDCQTGTIGVLIGVQKNVCTVVFVVAKVSHLSVQLPWIAGGKDALSSTSVRLKSQNVGTSTSLKIESVDWTRHGGLI